MQGVIIYLMIGAILFIPVGFIAGYLQHKKNNKKEYEDKVKSHEIIRK